MTPTSTFRVLTSPNMAVSPLQGWLNRDSLASPEEGTGNFSCVVGGGGGGVVTGVINKRDAVWWEMLTKYAAWYRLELWFWAFVARECKFCETGNKLRANQKNDKQSVQDKVYRMSARDKPACGWDCVKIQQKISNKKHFDSALKVIIAACSMHNKSHHQHFDFNQDSSECTLMDVSGCATGKAKFCWANGKQRRVMEWCLIE